MGHLALIPAPVAVSVIVMQQLHWFSRVTLLTARVPVGLGSADRTAASVLRVTGATALMAARVSLKHTYTKQEEILHIISCFNETGVCVCVVCRV